MNDLPSLPAEGAGLTSLVDLLDRVVARGAVVNGDVIITLAGVDLIRLDLRLLLAAVDEIDR
ncbi:MULTISPECIES: gas vesicle protein GvpJ [unclassified Amycolatopsis]|uniref:gas vesicle protein GvpJ n=1 Tax=unclassified Amycolatopsis TaxID=2618356 RepID=UPI002E1DF1CB|nr:MULTISPECIES: gas vesicle protein GvpJ [unclassified Amycolatopsis]